MRSSHVRLQSTNTCTRCALVTRPAAGVQVKKWCSVFVVAAAIAVTASLAQQTGFAAAGMELTRRLRVLLLSTLLRQV